MFVCPSCLSALIDEPARLHCARCDRSFAKVDGIPVFAEKYEDHWGWLPKSAIDRVLSERTRRGWDHAVRDLVGEEPELLRHILRRSAAEARAAGTFLLSLTPQSRVLDMGCGLGAFAFSLARSCREVVAMDLMPDHLRWIRGCAQELGIDNLILACGGDTPRLPFPDSSFDAVVMSGVWEYIALVCPGEPTSVQQAFLKDIARVLKPQGQVYIGIENRLSWRYFCGLREEHTRLRFIALLPRRIANLVHRRLRGAGLRIYTHSMGRYQRMLREAGFPAARIFYPLPKYSRIERLFPLEINSHRSLEPTATFHPGGFVDRLLSSNPARHFARSFVIIGQRAPRPSLLEELTAAARANCTEARVGEASWNLERYEVRTRTDKLYLHLRAGNDIRLLGKVPLRPLALEHLRTTYGVLAFLHGEARLSAETKALIPRPMGHACAGAHEIFLEEWRPGVNVRQARGAREPLAAESMRYLIRLHFETQERRRIDEALYNDHFGRRLQALRWWFSPPELERLDERLRRLDAYCRAQLMGAELPFVVRHGDFSSTNRLFDPRTRHLVAVVDWDSAETGGLPLLDAIRLHLDHQRNALGPHSPIIENSLRCVPETLLSDAHRALYDDYLGELAIEPHLFVALALMYWAQLVMQHYPVHRCRWDPIWRRENLLAVLERWETRLRL
jgi:SAM-dependent methyltransferase